MRATVMFGTGDVRIENVPDSSIQQPTDTIIRVTRACICGSDLWPYNLGPAPGGQRMGHEAIGHGSRERESRRRARRICCRADSREKAVRAAARN